MGPLPQVVLTAAGVQVACQLFKVVYYSVRDGKFSPGYFVSAGGVPSAHTAFVTALTVAIGIRNGITSDLFAVSFVFSTIVVYDAFRLRGHVQTHAKILNKLVIAESGETPVSEMVGHSIPEILWGLVIGGGLSAIVTYLL